MPEETPRHPESEVDLPTITAIDIPLALPQPATFMKVAKDISLLGIAKLCGENYLWRGMLYPSLLIHASPEFDWLRTTGIMFALQNMVFIPLTAPVFAVNIQGAPLVGEIQVLKEKLAALERSEDIEKIADIKQELAMKIAALRLLYQNGFIIMLGVGTPIIATLLLSEQVLEKLTHDKEVSSLGGYFLRLITPSIYATIHGLLSEQILASSNYTHGLRLSPLALMAGITLALSMGFGYGFPKLKTIGIAVGYNVDSYLNAGLLAYFIYFHSKFKDFTFMQAAFDVLRLKGGNKEQLFSLLKTGFYILSTISSEMILAISMATMIERLGVKEARVNTMVSQYMLAQLALVVNFAVASMIVLGVVLGSKREFDVYLTCRNGLFTVVGAASIIPLFFALFPGILMKIAGEKDEKVSLLLWQYTKWMLLASIADATRFVALFDLRINGDARDSAIICCVSQLLGIPLAAFLAFYLEMGLNGVGLAYATVMWAGASALILRLYQFMKPYRDIYQQYMRTLPAEDVTYNVGSSRQGFFARISEKARDVHPSIPLRLSTGVCNE